VYLKREQAKAISKYIGGQKEPQNIPRKYPRIFASYLDGGTMGTGNFPLKMQKSTV
jgi:hypothetical protein